MGKHIKEHIDLVELLKALLLDSDKVYEKYSGPLQQHDQQGIPMPLNRWPVRG